ncbi:unnamed protein product [Arctogadus glacialis]
MAVSVDSLATQRFAQHCVVNVVVHTRRSSDAPGSDMPGSALDRCGARDSRLSMREAWRAGEQWGPDLLPDGPSTYRGPDLLPDGPSTCRGPDLLPDGPLNLQGISPLARQENVELLHVVG